MTQFITDKETPYLTGEAQKLVDQYIKQGIDKDLAVEMVVDKLGEERSWDL